MASSTNSVIHYTDSIEKVRLILSEGFRVKYCVERINVQSPTPGEGVVYLHGAFPMVCFCDIPLSEVKNHLASYGYYGIGLTKQWAASKGMNPVLYVDDKSRIGTSIMARFRAVPTLKTMKDWANDFLALASYLKNYEGPLQRGDVKHDRYRFYDEREWRYVPDIDQLGDSDQVVLTDTYLENKAKYNDALKLNLSFEPEHVSYIIVHKTDEIPDIVRHLRNVFSEKCTMAALEILLTKVISAEQIISDF